MNTRTLCFPAETLPTASLRLCQLVFLPIVHPGDISSPTHLVSHGSRRKCDSSEQATFFRCSSSDTLWPIRQFPSVAGASRGTLSTPQAWYSASWDALCVLTTFYHSQHLLFKAMWSTVALWDWTTWAAIDPNLHQWIIGSHNSASNHWPDCVPVKIRPSS